MRAVRRYVESLAAMERRSASPGERASAEWVAGRLRDAGAHDVGLQSFRYQHTFGHAHACHCAAGLAAAAIGGPAGRALASAALVSLELELSGRRQWIRRLLPAGEGTNVVARVPARGEPRRTLVLVAHHDAANTGLMWNPRLVGPSMRRAARTGRVPSFAAPLELALAGVALGFRRLGGALLALGIALFLDVARGATVPGASDNATGVAALLALVEGFARDPLDGVEVVALVPGCEESGMGGMAAWLRSVEGKLDPSRTLVLGVDTLGAGEPVVLGAEGPLLAARYREEDVALAERAAVRAALPPPRRFRIGGWTDPVLALFAGLPAISILSVRGGAFPNYHLPTDTPDRVDWRSVEDCTRLAAAVAETWVDSQLASLRTGCAGD
jgi:hypothetical protein